MIGPFIFLDIDGVLNGHKQHDNSYCGLDPDNVRLLNGLIAEFKATCVVTSAWRYFVLRGEMTVAGFSGMMCTHGLARFAVADVVGPDRDDGKRAPLIRDWFRQRYGTAHVTRFVVLDDMDLGYSEDPLLAPRFFQTKPEMGLYSLVNGGWQPGKMIEDVRRCLRGS